MLPILPGRRSMPSTLPWTNSSPAPAVPILGFFGLGHQPLFNQENIPFPVPAIWNQPWTLTPNAALPQCVVRGRPILGRRSEPNHIEESTTNGITSGGKSQNTNGDSTNDESDKGVKRICRPPSPDDNSWPVNGNNNNNDKQCAVLAVNTSVPPPPIPPLIGPPRPKEEYYFRPIQQSQCNPVELHVTNLDQSIDLREMKKLLMAAFREHVMVLHVSVFVQSDGSAAASVKVPSAQDAQYAISQLHRRKVGFKRIMISHGHSSSVQNPQLIKSQIVSLLLEVPGHKMPLFTFRELFAARFLASVSVSDLYRMRDVCVIAEENNGRAISLNPDHHHNTPSPTACADSSGPELPFCARHGNQLGSGDKGWAEQEQPNVVNVRARLSELAERVTSLVHGHDNRLPLASLPDCYAAQFEPLEMLETGGSGAAPLEHLVTCISGVELVHSGGSKALRLCPHKPALDNKSDESSIVLSVSPSLASQVHLFARELVDLLKTQPSCQLQFNRFIPAYHHHFGRQCRVADYGFTKLIDLLETLPHVVQVIGEGSRRIVTLSHRAQVRRFTSDLLRVLKAQASKQMLASELPQLFERTLGRPFEPSDYGLCYLDDLLNQLPANVVLVSPSPSASPDLDATDTVVAIPKREQTAEEVERTKQFALQVVELLSHAPQCTMEFAKFIPAYHHHYGAQCRVSDFGFTKLIELFEAIPHVVKIDEEGALPLDRKVSLTLSEKLIVLANQMAELVSPHYPPGLPIEKINSYYLWQFGYGLKPSVYGCSTINDLLDKLPTIKVVERGDDEWTIVPACETNRSHTLVSRSLRILWPQVDGRLTLYAFHNAYLQHFNASCTTKQLVAELQGVVEVSEDKFVQLTPLQLFGRDVYHLLSTAPQGQLPLAAFEASFCHMFGSVPSPAQFGRPDMLALLRAIDNVVSVVGRGPNRTLVLNAELVDIIRLPVPQTPLKTKNLRPKREGGVRTVWNKGANGYEPSVVIQLPEPSTPPSAEQCMALLSPARFLLPATRFPFHLPPPPSPTAPDPSALPRPTHFNLTRQTHN